VFGHAFFGARFFGPNYWGPGVTSANTQIDPLTGQLQITGYIPTLTQTVSGNTAIDPLSGQLQISGYAPTLAQTANQALTPITGQIQISGYIPTVIQASASTSLFPLPGQIQIQGYAPILTQTGQDEWGGAQFQYPNWRPYQLRKEEWEKKIPPVVAQAIERVARSAKTGAAAEVELEAELGEAQYQARYAKMLQALQQSQFSTLKALRGQQLKAMADQEDDDVQSLMLLM
jgi:hypothetical protein